MAKSRSDAPRTVVKQEDNEAVSRWIECKALLANIWKEVPAVPSIASRRAWAVAHGVDPARVHRWFGTKKSARARKGVLHHSRDDYALPLEDASEEQPSSSASLNVVPALDNPSSPSYLSMSSPLPQTPMDMYSDLPVTFPSGALFGESQAVHPLSLEMSHSKSRQLMPTPGIHPSKVDLTIKTEIVDAASLSDKQAPQSRKPRKIILRIAPDAAESSSNRPLKEPGNLQPTTATARSKKQRRVKKAPKTEAVDSEGRISGQQEAPFMEPVGPTMDFPQAQTFPPGFCAPYFTYMNPAMAFATGMTGTYNLPSHSFGNMIFNPFTGAPLFNNVPPQFSAFPGQPSQPALFNGNMDVGHFAPMFPQVPAPALPGPSMNFPGATTMDQSVSAGDFQGFQQGIPLNGATNPQNLPEPTMSLTDFLNEPLDAAWIYR
ncbi:unnamed protein product [Rhizoctonia solani]|uniref:Homeobox domain-containing protein n=3 Tax=Rhizoctonia solani TaxID=456999 RepID=A0A8H3ADH1_9AGAM|nr:Gar1 domain protein [Rhizoctonia solani AG-3 Rhs1AP]KEP48944.1 Gar1 domain protein [Rhizoctonia solani 123E]CAE6415691.1 unnamed protein product [Rhizoctonia solani]CAE6417916.1 unnamed protein product [Rhizoctonia solani]